MNYFVPALIAVLVFASLTFAIEIEAGQLIPMDLDSTEFGGVFGTARMRIGGLEWYPDAVWLVPEGYTISDFTGNYTGQHYQVPSDLNLTNNCYSTIYSAGDKRAFKASVKEGKFCILANPGSYDMVADY